MNISEMTTAQRQSLSEFLRIYFPEITSDEDTNGADTIDRLSQLYARLLIPNRAENTSIETRFSSYVAVPKEELKDATDPAEAQYNADQFALELSQAYRQLYDKYIEPMQGRLYSNTWK